MTKPPPPALSACAALVRRADPDRFLTALFAPPARREALFTLYAFNVELARAREATREPMMAMIRLQWWREVLEGAARAHEVATPLRGLLADGALKPADLLPLIEARERDLEPFGDLAGWRDWLLLGAGGLAVAAGRVLGHPAERLRCLGAAYGVAGVMRSVPALASTGRCLLPGDVLADHGLTADMVVAAPRTAALHPVFARLANEGLAWCKGRGWLGPALAAGLPAVLARRDLHRPGVDGPRALGDKVALIRAAVFGL